MKKEANVRILLCRDGPRTERRGNSSPMDSYGVFNMKFDRMVGLNRCSLLSDLKIMIVSWNKRQPWSSSKYACNRRRIWGKAADR